MSEPDPPQPDSPQPGPSYGPTTPQAYDPQGYPSPYTPPTPQAYDPQGYPGPYGPQAAQPYDPPTPQAYDPQGYASPYGPQAAQPYDPLPGQAYDPRTGLPLAPPPAPQSTAPYYNAPYGGAPYGPPPGYSPTGYSPQFYGGYPQARPTNGMAIASLVLGILWLYWVGSILALVFGYIAKQQIRERGEVGGGMATAGIVLGWIGVGLLGVMMVIMIIGAVIDA
jgi:hypothetical protein